MDRIQNKCNNEPVLLHNYELTIQSIVDLKQYLYYHHCDYRSYTPYKRVSNEIFVKDGIKASNANKLRTAAKKVSVNGVKDVWAFAKLPYVDVSENICYDPFHVMLNVVTYIYKYLLGKRGIGVESRRFCHSTSSHPCLYKLGTKVVEYNTKPIWELTQTQNAKIENSYLSAVVFPIGKTIL